MIKRRAHTINAFGTKKAYWELRGSVTVSNQVRGVDGWFVDTDEPQTEYRPLRPVANWVSEYDDETGTVVLDLSPVISVLQSRFVALSARAGKPDRVVVKGDKREGHWYGSHIVLETQDRAFRVTPILMKQQGDASRVRKLLIAISTPFVAPSDEHADWTA